jgi:hypothetical protein
MAIKIIIKGFDTATAKVKAAVATGIQSSLAVAGARGEALVKQNILSPYGARPPAVATGNLVNSVQFQVSQEAGFSRAVIFSGPPADGYVDPVETGTRPHFPPPSALLLWVKKKFSVTTEKQALSIAFAIARNISKRGTTAFKMFERAFATLESELQGIFQAQIAKAIEASGTAPGGAGGTK